MQELAGLAVEHVVERIAIGGHDELAGLALPIGVDQDLDLVGVPVVGVVRRELEPPDDLARVWIEGQQAVRVEVVAGAQVTVPVGCRVADWPVQ